MFALAAKLLLRELAQPSLRLVIITLAIGLASVQIIQISTDRYLTALQQQAVRLLGADMELRSSHKLDAIDLSAFADLEFAVAERISFPSMLFVEDDLRLSQVRAVSSNYPLRGGYLVRLPDGSEQTLGAPQAGEIWIDEQLRHSLSLQFGQQVELAGVDLGVAGIVLEGPGVFGSFASFAPRVLINLDDIADSELFESGSRVRYRLAFSAEDSGTIEEIYSTLTEQLTAGQRISRADDADSDMGDTIKRARAFFYLSGCLSLLFAIISALLAISHYQMYQQKFVAVAKTLGLTPRKLRSLYLLQIILLATLAMLLGTFLAEVGQRTLVAYIKRFYQLELPPAQLSSYLWGVICLIMSLGLVVLPKLGELLRTPAWLVLRGDNGNTAFTIHRLQLLAALLCSFLVAWLYSRSLWLSLSFSAVVLILALASAAAYWWALRYLRPRLPSRPEFSVAAASLRANWQLNALQCAALTVCAFLIFTLLLIRFALVGDWERQVPADSPNYFLINIQDQQREQLSDFWQQRNARLDDMYAIVRGRLSSVNAVDATERAEALEIEHDSLRRELNFSWSKDVPEGNILLEGEWWPSTWDPELPPVSVELDSFRQLQLQLGDIIAIDVAGTELRARITSVREVDWGNLRANFYFLFPPGALDGWPQTYIASARIASDDLEALPAFYSQFPSISLISIEEVITRLRGVINQVAQAVEGILLLMLLSMFMLLTAALNIMQQRRRRDLAILRVLGMRSATFVKALRWEFLFMVVLAGLLGLLLSETIIGVLVVLVFGNQPSWHWWLWLAGLPGMLLLGLILAQLAQRRLKQSPAQMIRG